MEHDMIFWQKARAESELDDGEFDGLLRLEERNEAHAEVGAPTEPQVMRSQRPVPARAAIAAATGFVCMAGFEIALALGAPLGRAAWGGQSAELQPGLRIASVGSAALLVFAALIVLGRVGSRLSPLPETFCRRGTWVLVGVLTLGTLMNLASPSVWERSLQAPIALVMAVLCFVVARGGFPDRRR
jgi:hypothetical protein